MTKVIYAADTHFKGKEQQLPKNIQQVVVKGDSSSLTSNTLPESLQILTTAQKMAVEDFKSKNFLVRLIRIGKGKTSFYEYTVSSINEDLTSDEFQAEILKKSGVKENNESIEAALKAAEESHFLILNLMVKESQNLYGRYDKSGKRIG